MWEYTTLVNMDDTWICFFHLRVSSLRIGAASSDFSAAETVSSCLNLPETDWLVVSNIF